MKSRPVAALVVAAGLMVGAGCSSADETSGVFDVSSSDDSADNSSDSSDDSGSSTDTPRREVDAPVATLPDDIPESFAEAFAPVDVTGEPLVELDTTSTDDPAIGTVAPTLVGIDIDGKPIGIDATLDGPTMLLFLAHWCPHCNDELPVIKELADDGKLDGINVVGIATASNPERPNFPPTDWLRDNDWPYPAMLEGVAIADTADGPRQVLAALTAFGGSGFPYAVLIDDDGSVAARWSGAKQPDEIVELIDENLRS